MLGLSDTETTRKAFPFPFTLRYSITIDGPQSLSTSLTVMNTSPDKPLDFTGALHTYFACASSSAVQVHGLEGIGYENSAAGGAQEVQDAPTLAFRGETDRIYFGTPSELYLSDVGADRRHLKVLKMGFPDAVAWNIGGEKAASLKDLANGEWQQYVCLEAALVGKPYKLAPGASYCAGQTFTAGVALPDAKKKKKVAAVGVS